VKDDSPKGDETGDVPKEEKLVPKPPDEKVVDCPKLDGFERFDIVPKLDGFENVSVEFKSVVIKPTVEENEFFSDPPPLNENVIESV
jgi:hypothetical protein